MRCTGRWRAALHRTDDGGETLSEISREGAASATRTVGIGTDIAALMLFHPADLADRADWPIAWYDDAFAYEPLATAGLLAVFYTGSDGGYRVRLAIVPDGKDPLSEAERERLVVAHDARLHVRHGGVLLDNGDALPHEDAVSEADGTTFDLPSGLYRVRIHALDIRPLSEAGTLTDDDVDYAIAFTPVDRAAFEAIPVAVRPPDLRPRPVEERRLNDLHGDARALSAHEERFGLDAPGLSHSFEDARAALGGPLPVLPRPGTAMLPGEERTFDVSERWQRDLYRRVPGERRARQLHHHVLAFPEGHAGAFGTLCDVRGASTSANGPWTVSLLGLDLVRLVGTSGDMMGRLRAALGGGTRDPWGDGEMRLALAEAASERRKTEPALEPAVADRLKPAIAALIDRDERSDVLGTRPTSHSYARASIGAAQTPEALLDWLLHHLDLPGAERLAIWPAAPPERLRRLEARVRELLGGA